MKNTLPSLSLPPSLPLSFPNSSLELSLFELKAVHSSQTLAAEREQARLHNALEGYILLYRIHVLSLSLSLSLSSLLSSV